MPPRKASLLLIAPLVLTALLLLASPALAADPPSTAAVIKSATFDSGVAPFSVGEIKSERPSLAYWGPIANVRRGTAGQSLWCAGTRQFPSIYAPSGFFPSYPYWGQLVQRTAEPVRLVSTTPARLTYQGFAGSKVSSIVVKSATGTVYKADTDYTTALDAQGYTTIARKNTVIPSGATVYVDYYWPTSGTRGIATLNLPELEHYYRSWLSLYYLMPSLGAGDTNSFSFNWVDTSAPTTTDSHYGFPKVTGWTRIERELSDGQSVKLSRRPGQLRVQFFEFTDGTGTRNGQGAAIDDVVVTGFKYGPVRELSAQLVGDDVKLSWLKPQRTPTDASVDERTIAYRVWRKANGVAAWTELTSGARLTPSTSPITYTDTSVEQGNIYEYTVQAWDIGTGAGYGVPKTALCPVNPDADLIAPTLSVTGVSDGASYRAPVTPIIKAADNVAVASLAATLNDVPFVIDSTISMPGQHKLVITAVDVAGNTTTRSISFRIDLTAPVISVKGVTDGARYSAPVTPTFSATDSGGAVALLTATLNGSAFKSGTSVSALGTHELVVTARDAAGNTATQRVRFTVSSTTSVSLSAPSTSAYRSARLAGRLYDSSGKTVGNKRIELQYSYDKVKWTTFAATYTNQKDSKGWKYVYTAKPSRKTYYRARFAGDSSYYADYSAIDATLPKVYVTRPSFGRTTLAYGKTYKATGYLKPRHKAYTYPVKIAAYRYENGKYRWKKSYAAKAYNYSSYTKYVRSIKLPSKGKWRLRVVHAADSLNAKTYSSYRYVTVK